MITTEFTPLASFIGGALIGLAAVIFMLSEGRIAGVSGIVSRLLPPTPLRDISITSIAFIAGLILAYPLVVWFKGDAPAFALSGGTGLLILAGALVGFGAVLGNGCTSGHGVCGLSRFSARSIVATAVFMSTAVVTVYLLRHWS